MSVRRGAAIFFLVGVAALPATAQEDPDASETAGEEPVAMTMRLAVMR